MLRHLFNESPAIAPIVSYTTAKIALVSSRWRVPVLI